MTLARWLQDGLADPVKDLRSSAGLTEALLCARERPNQGESSALAHALEIRGCAEESHRLAPNRNVSIGRIGADLAFAGMQEAMWNGAVAGFPIIGLTGAPP